MVADSSVRSEEKPLAPFCDDDTGTDRSNGCSRCMVVFKQQLPLLVVLVCLVAAAPLPEPGAKFYHHINHETIQVLFFLAGVVIKIAELRKGAAALHVHVLCQLYSMVFFPLSYYVLVYLSRWPENLGILTRQCGTGLMAGLALPTPTSTPVLWTQLADGEVAIAAVNAVIGNVVGAVFSPIMATWLIGAEADVKPTVHTMVVKPLQLIIGPMAVGVVMQLLIRCASVKFYEKLVPIAKYILEVVMIIITYFLFCSAFSGGTHGLNVGNFVGMLVWITLVHLFYFGLVWVICLKFGLRRRIAFAFTASQKTDAMAVPIMQSIFPAQWGVYMLPIVAYHSVQMIVAASLCGPFKRRVALLDCDRESAPEDTAAVGTA